MVEGQFWEDDPSQPLELIGEFLGWDETTGDAIWGPLEIGPFGYDDRPETVPSAPALASTQVSRTAIDLGWVAGDDSGKPPVQTWEVEVRVSTNDAVSFGAWTPVTGSPFPASTFGLSRSALSTGTPEHVFEHRVRGVNGDGVGDWSNIRRDQWDSVTINPPTAPTNFAPGIATPTSQQVTWQATNDPSVIRFRIMEGGVVLVPTIDPGARVWNIDGLAQSSTHTNVGIQRANLAADGVTVQWSPVSNRINFTLPEDEPWEVEMLIGCSDSDNDHGSPVVDQPDLNWKLWRVYGTARATSIANRTGALRPTRLFMSHDGPNLGGANPNLTAVRNEALAYLNSFYYTGGATSQVHSARWGIELMWSNGNENHDKGALDPGQVPSQADRIARFNISMQGLWEAVHFIDPQTNQRRFPDAYCGSNPVHEAEMNGELAYYLGPSARWHDFIIWSAYPPGRQTTNVDPTYNWPSTSYADRTNRTLGYQVRCFYRTDQMRIQKRLDLNDPDADITIGVGEYGIGDDPGDTTTRPYFLVNGWLLGWYRNCVIHRFVNIGVCYWDQMKKQDGVSPCQWDDNSPENLLSTGKDCTGALRRHEPVGTNPSSADAIRAWDQLSHHMPGGVRPASWAANPKTSGTGAWKTTGTVI